jgi:uncharacterized membrane protein YagU involved in acid resistance
MVEEKEALAPDTDALPNRGSLGARLLAGIAAGIVGGLLMISFMMTYARLTGAGLTMPLKELAALVYGVEALVVGPAALLTGASIQLGFAIVVGILFALCVTRRTSMVAALFAGTAIGIAIWLLMDLLVLPLTNPTMASRVALIPLAYFIAHVLYGLGLAVTPILVRAFSRDDRHHRKIREEEAHAI